MRINKFLIIVISFFLALVIIYGVLAFQSNSSTYSSRSKFDFGSAGTNASSTNFIQRFISGNQPVSQYISSAYSGRFGILDEKSSIAINLTSPLINAEVARGGNIISNEDTENLVPDFINLFAKIYVNDTGAEVPGAIVYFYFNDTLVGNNATNSTGSAVISYNKTTYSAGIYNLSVNYSHNDYELIINNSLSNFSLNVFNIPNTQGNRGVATQYVWNQTAIFYFNITKANSSGTFFYDSQNITANATDSNDKHYPAAAYVSGYRLKKNAQGQYESRVFLNQTLLSTYTAVIKWKIYISDDNYSTYLGSARHSDIDVVAGPICGNSLIETGEGCDDGNLVAGDGCSASCAVEGTTLPPGGGGGPPPEICVDECTSGATEERCVTSGTLRTRICGNYDIDTCTEWGGESYSDCGAGRICQNAECVVETCDQNTCREWSECTNGVQTRTCVTPGCEISRGCEICTEDWKCLWTICTVGDEYSYPYDCVDLNNCGTETNKPINPKVCEVNLTGWDCGEWGECKVKYDIGNIISGETMAEGYQERECSDNEGRKKLDKRTCSLAIPIDARKVEWCEEDYVEIFNTETSELVSRIKETEITKFSELKKVDISFITSEFTGYCDYCFDGVKNYDETGLDCGGPSCPECVSKYTFFDWLYWVILISWTIFWLFIFILFWKRRKEEKKKEVRKKTLFEKIKLWFTNIWPSKREERIREKKVENFFRNLFRKKERKVEEIRKPEIKLKRVISPEERMLTQLKIKLREWKEEGYAGTSALESKIIGLENKIKNKEKNFVSRIISNYRRKREERKLEKIRLKRQKDIEEGRKEREKYLEKIRRQKEWRQEEVELIGKGKKFGKFFKDLFKSKKKIKEHKEPIKHKKSWIRSLIGAYKRKSAERKERKRIEKKHKEIRKGKSLFRKLVDKYKLRKERKRYEKRIKKIRKEIEKKTEKPKKSLLKKVMYYYKLRRERKNQERNKKKIQKEFQKRIKTEKKARRKERKKKIRKLKREVRKRKFINLMRKLRLWKKEGYYGTAHLEEEIRRLKIQEE